MLVEALKAVPDAEYHLRLIILNRPALLQRTARPNRVQALAKINIAHRWYTIYYMNAVLRDVRGRKRCALLQYLFKEDQVATISHVLQSSTRIF